MKNLITTMAGVATEDYVFGMLSTGGENDLEQATNTAHAMVSVYGMSDAIGPVTVGEKPGEMFIAREMANTEQRGRGHPGTGGQQRPRGSSTRPRRPPGRSSR